MTRTRTRVRAALAGALALGLTPIGIVPLLLLAGALGVVRYGSRPWWLAATTVVAALQGVLVWSPPWLHLPALPGWASSSGASPHPPVVRAMGSGGPRRRFDLS